MMAELTQEVQKVIPVEAPAEIAAAVPALGDYWIVSLSAVSYASGFAGRFRRKDDHFPILSYIKEVPAAIVFAYFVYMIVSVYTPEEHFHIAAVLAAGYMGSSGIEITKKYAKVFIDKFVGSN